MVTKTLDVKMGGLDIQIRGEYTPSEKYVPPSMTSEDQPAYPAVFEVDPEFIVITKKAIELLEEES